MPNRFSPVSTSSSNNASINQMNSNFAKLDREAVVKQFKGNSGEVLTIGKTGNATLGLSVSQGTTAVMQLGKYSATRYGFLLYDAAGIPNILIGQSPDDGRMGVWVAAPGQNVITLLGG